MASCLVPSWAYVIALESSFELINCFYAASPACARSTTVVERSLFLSLYLHAWRQENKTRRPHTDILFTISTMATDASYPQAEQAIRQPEPHPYLHDPLLYISNVPPHVTDADLALAFSQCAPFRPNIPQDGRGLTRSGTIEFRFVEKGVANACHNIFHSHHAHVLAS